MTDATGERSLGDVDVVFPILHGRFGEDGTVQGLLELVGLPYVGNGVLASAIGMDKHVTKTVLEGAGIEVAPWVTLTRAGLAADPELWGRRTRSLGLPVFVKPARAGSSVGISKAWSEADLDGALAHAFEHDPVALVERFSDGLEVECSVLGHREPEASTPGEIVINADWYDYEAKYEPGGMELVIPARVPESVLEEVRRLAVEVFRLVDCSGMARVDFFVEGDSVLVNELNTIPGFTSTSVYAKLWEASGLPYVELLERLLALALERQEEARRYRF